MVAWSVNGIKLEVVNAAALLGSVSAIAAYAKLKAAICNKIQTLWLLDSGSALELQVAVTEAALPEDSQLAVQGALNSQLALASGLVVQGVNAGPMKQQKLLWITNYLTQLDWDELHSCMVSNVLVSWSMGKMSMVLVRRLKRLGVNSLHEQTTKVAVAVVVVLWAEKFGSLPNQKFIYELVQYFKKAFAACPVNPSHLGLTYLGVYP
jgi:hypothetical protein